MSYLIMTGGLGLVEVVRSLEKEIRLFDLILVEKEYAFFFI